VPTGQPGDVLHRGQKEDHDPADIEVENPAEALEKALVKAGLRIKTAEQLVAKARTEGLVERILARLPRMIDLANGRPPAERVKYITGAVNGELNLQPLEFTGGLQQAKDAAALEKKSDEALKQLADCGNKIAEKILEKRRGEE
jgi:hypothetical protein